MLRRSFWPRLIRWLIGALLGGQALTVAVLTIRGSLRKRRAPPASFPHGRQGATAVDDTAAEVFTYGQDLYDAMLAAIDAASTTIFLETFIWKGDALGQAIKDHLIRKAAEGVQVYVIFDGFANLIVRPSFKRFPPTIHTLEYRALARIWYALDPRRYARDHRKLLVIDNTVAFLGGYNLGTLYATQWRDTHLCLRGPVAADLGHTFVDFWNNNRGSRPAIVPNAPGPWSTSIQFWRNDPGRLVFPIRGMYLDAIERARSHIYLTNAYFVPDRVILTALIDAVERGVDVRILVPWESNHMVVDWLSRSFFELCLDHGVRIFGYQHAMIHAKTATIDGIWSTIGTANLDRLSLAGNYEINVEIRDATFAAEMERIFMTDLTNAVEVTRDQWEQRPWYGRVSQLILRPLRPLL